MPTKNYDNKSNFMFEDENGMHTLGEAKILEEDEVLDDMISKIFPIVLNRIENKTNKKNEINYFADLQSDTILRLIKELQKNDVETTNSIDKLKLMIENLLQTRYLLEKQQEELSVLMLCSNGYHRKKRKKLLKIIFI